MLKDYLEQRYISLESGRSSIALEREYWNALEVMAEEEGWGDWRDFFYAYILDDKPDGIPLASHVRKFITLELFIEYVKGKGKGKDNSWNWSQAVIVLSK